MRALIKICGITQPTDALAAVAAGAGAIGLVFALSPRRVDPAQARAIIAALPAGVVRVGVFVDTPESEIAAIANEVGLDTLQLLGERIPVAAASLHRWKIWRGLRLPLNPGGDNSALAEAAIWSTTADAFLLEPAIAGRHGGTGATFDWSAARSLATRLPLVVAGGLTPENVAAAIRATGAQGVDVSSGVESAPGKKDPARMRAFAAAARAAFEESLC